MSRIFIGFVCAQFILAASLVAIPDDFCFEQQPRIGTTNRWVVLGDKLEPDTDADKSVHLSPLFDTEEEAVEALDLWLCDCLYKNPRVRCLVSTWIMGPDGKPQID